MALVPVPLVCAGSDEEELNVDGRLRIVGTGVITTGLGHLAAVRGEVVIWARSQSSAERASNALHGAAQPG
jgi:hypothetical protein